MKPIKQTLTAFLIAFAIGGGLAGCASDHHAGASGTGSTSVSGSDGSVTAGEASFARQACQADVAQAEIGKLAAANTKNEAVRSLAKQLVKDHTRAEKELAGIFTRKGITGEPQLAENLQTSINHLAELKGAAFDEAFKQQVIEDHEKAIPFFEKQAEQGTDSDLKDFAQKLLPRLRQHLETAQRLSVGIEYGVPPPDRPVEVILNNPASRGIFNVPR
jgi:putative membrane protein